MHGIAKEMALNESVPAEWRQARAREFSPSRELEMPERTRWNDCPWNAFRSCEAVPHA